MEELPRTCLEPDPRVYCDSEPLFLPQLCDPDILQAVSRIM